MPPNFTGSHESSGFDQYYHRKKCMMHFDWQREAAIDRNLAYLAMPAILLDANNEDMKMLA